jgi:hypothetical protein
VNAESERAVETTSEPPKWPLLALGTLVAAEALMMAAVTLFLVVEVLTQPSLSLASSIALTVLALIAAAALAALATGIFREQPWVRGLTAVWQLLQVAAAVTIIQGDMADALGWALAFASLIGLLLVFSPAVSARLRRAD